VSEGPPTGRRTLEGGVAGPHEVPQLHPVRVGPATADEFNTVTAGIIPVACFRFEDIRFAFGSSFVTPATRDELAELAELIKAHPGSPLSVFGHADPVGQDPDNKVLSGRRAIAIYALLIRDTAMWEELYSRPQGSDRWGQPALRAMHETVNPPAPGAGGAPPETIAAIDRDRGQRQQLFAAYMDALCGQKLKLAKTDFLARGADAGGKGDFQGCSEFNPVLVFSQPDQQRFEQAQDKSERNAANAPNRRVMVLLFRKGTKVDPAKWPCPRAREGIAGCQRRFWTDGEARRSRRLAAKARIFEESKDTFACRFYHRLTTGSPCETIPVRPTATLEIIRDQDRDRTVDERDPVLTFVRFGIWDNAYDAAGNVRNAAAENQNFVGDDVRRFYFRVRDPAAGASVTINWKTLKSDKSDDDAPASQALTLVETRAGSRVFVSRAVMLVTDDTDARQATDSGLAAPLPDVGSRTRGQSNHRLRRASIEGFVKAEYAPAGGGPKAEVERPVFNRDPDERRRVSVRVINYNTSATAAYIGAQFARANQRWNQVGIQIDALATVDRPIPAAALDATGQYGGSANNANEAAALNDLIPITPDNTVTAVFVPLSGANAYATIGQRTTVTLADRFFIFINPNLNLENVTLAHELHHVLFNRFDSATARQFYTFNTSPPPAGTALPDVRIRRRIHNQHSPDPDNDAANANVLNWARRTRTARFPVADALTSVATATTGNTLAQAF
jgi:hypothetical protein